MREFLSSVRTRLRRVVSRAPGDSGDAVVTDGGAARAAGGLVDRLDERFGEDFTESAPFWLPPFLLVGLFVYGAIAWNFVISLTDYQGFIGPDYSDLDFEMYVRAANDSGVIDATVNTFLLVVAFTAVRCPPGVGLRASVRRAARLRHPARAF